ncbi:amidohydrolase family protein [uncultured Kordia sp.]|uniref:amidohydrolase family protein n=1 Tax=uncultured Kordia sp. TaxID=507699 RepID=UPI0026294A58|nr:amidohydrolase family protein [uncultured Kordia sp.]
MNDENPSCQKNIFIEEDKIESISVEKKVNAEIAIGFPSEVIAFPGLVNSHEHLALNTHPIHKNKQYSDYVEWSLDDFEATIKEIESIPFELRYAWGVLKNVLHGFTTIFQHDIYLKNYQTPIADVVIDTMTIHSLRFDKKWKLKAMFPTRKKKIIHLGEGTSALAKTEPARFLKFCIQPKNMLAVHAISLTKNDAAKFGGVIWCPNSNIHLYGETAQISELKKVAPILFGTDSTVSSDWDLWQHVRQARKLKQLSDVELFESMTKTPANLFGFSEKGTLETGKMADIVIARKQDKNAVNAFYKVTSKDILLIVKTGKIIYYDESLQEQVMKFVDKQQFEAINIQNEVKYICFGVKKLTAQLKKYYPDFTYDSFFNIIDS